MSRGLIFTSFLILLFLGGGSAFAESEPYDLLVLGGKILTFDSDDRIIDDGYVLIHEGRVLRVGKRSRLPKGIQATKKIFAEGNLVLPGFINSGTDLLAYLSRNFPVSRASQREALQRIFQSERYQEVATRLACRDLVRRGTTGVIVFSENAERIAPELARCGIRAVVATDQVAPGKFIRRWKGNRRIQPALLFHEQLSGKDLRNWGSLGTKGQISVLAKLPSKGNLASWIAKMKKAGLFHERVLVFLEEAIPEKAWKEFESARVRVAWSRPDLFLPGRKSKESPFLGFAFLNPASHMDFYDELSTYSRFQKESSLNILKGAIHGGAYAANWDRHVGVLEIGRKADLQVVEQGGWKVFPSFDPIGNLVRGGSANEVKTVIIDGEVIFDKDRNEKINESALAKDVAEYEGRLRGILSQP